MDVASVLSANANYDANTFHFHPKFFSYLFISRVFLILNTSTQYVYIE